MQAGANQGLINRDGKTAKEVAVQYEKPQARATCYHLVPKFKIHARNIFLWLPYWFIYIWRFVVVVVTFVFVRTVEYASTMHDNYWTFLRLTFFNKSFIDLALIDANVSGCCSFFAKQIVTTLHLLCIARLGSCSSVPSWHHDVKLEYVWRLQTPYLHGISCTIFLD